ncbi:hypothetical protein G6F57_021756 [Rhizopus arrhizus]|nr:hypothetical protein G6F57_021756 [Rhizopus arrhizus]
MHARVPYLEQYVAFNHLYPAFATTYRSLRRRGHPAPSSQNIGDCHEASASRRQRAWRQLRVPPAVGRRGRPLHRPDRWPAGRLSRS